MKRLVAWVPPQDGDLKFKIDGAARGKPSPTGISAVLHNHRRNVLMMVSKNTGVKKSNEAEVMAILECLHRSFVRSLLWRVTQLML